MKRRIILLSITTLICVAVILVTTAANREVNRALRAVPSVIEFYEENTEFFDLLLGMRRRFEEFNEERQEYGEIQLTWYGFRITDYGLEISNNISMQRYGSHRLAQGSEHDVLTEEERVLIENTLRKLGGGANVSLERIGVGMRRFKGAYSISITLESVPDGAWRPWAPIWRTYVIEVNNDWSIYISTNIRQ